MKRLLFYTALFFSSCFSAIAQQVAQHYAGGDGTKESPFLISNAAELALLAQDVNTEKDFSLGRFFRLTQDIVVNTGVMATDLTKLQDYTGHPPFPETPAIGDFSSETDYKAFQGVFDGDGHTISGIYMTANQSVNYLALFRVVEDAEIRNLGIRDEFVYAGAYLGGIVGRAINSRIINCYVTDSHVFGWGSNSGGIVAQAIGTTKVQNCYYLGNLNGKNDMGGIVGRIGNGDVNKVIVENCYTTATITNRLKENKGGVTATNSEGSIVRNCYFTAAAADYAVWPAQNMGVEVGCTQMTEIQMQAESFLSVLNSNARQIAAACRWVHGENGLPSHDYAETTPDIESGRDVNMLAINPVPSNGDRHADMDGDTPALSWKAARDGKTVSQYIYIGTDSAAIANATPTSALAHLGAETNYQLSTVDYPLSALQTYYWRVDRVDAEGMVTAGDVWMFQPRHLAFPGAEGYGRFARGGRGGKAVYVTNLNSDGPGSLRWALTSGDGPRTVLFKVSGLIDMGFRQCIVDPCVTIAGQSAPGKGICIKGSDIGLGDDNICRFLRARRGLGSPDDTGNAIGTFYSDHTIMDHVTASWGTDETVSTRASHHVTFQRSIISEALGITNHRKYPEGTNHGYAATIGGDIGSFHHNLLANCNGRNWSMGGGADANGRSQGRLDMFNNVVYNWHDRTTDGGAMQMQFVNNYYKMGPDTRMECLFSADNEGGGERDQFAYVSGNVRDNRNNSLTEDKLNVTYRATGPQPEKTWCSEPFFPSYAQIESARDCYKSVLSDVGANQPYSDQTDLRIFRETLDRTYTYIGSKSGIRGEIDDEQDAGGFEDYPAEQWPGNYNSDLDGLPDWWEEIRGTRATPRGNYVDTNKDLEGDGYTELERYLDFMAQPHLLIAPGQQATVNVPELFRGYTNNPRYDAERTDAGVTATLANDGVLTVQGGEKKTLAEVRLRVTDADGSSYERRLCVAVTSYNTPLVNSIGDQKITIESANSSDAHADTVYYDLHGRRIDISSSVSGIYIQRSVNTQNASVRVLHYLR